MPTGTGNGSASTLQKPGLLQDGIPCQAALFSGKRTSGKYVKRRIFEESRDILALRGPYTRNREPVVPAKEKTSSPHNITLKSALFAKWQKRSREAPDADIQWNAQLKDKFFDASLTEDNLSGGPPKRSTEIVQGLARQTLSPPTDGVGLGSHYESPDEYHHEVRDGICGTQELATSHYGLEEHVKEPFPKTPMKWEDFRVTSPSIGLLGLNASEPRVDQIEPALDLESEFGYPLHNNPARRSTGQGEQAGSESRNDVSRKDTLPLVQSRVGVENTPSERELAETDGVSAYFQQSSDVENQGDSTNFGLQSKDLISNRTENSHLYPEKVEESGLHRPSDQVDANDALLWGPRSMLCPIVLSADARAVEQAMLGFSKQIVSPFESARGNRFASSKIDVDMQRDCMTENAES